MNGTREVSGNVWWRALIGGVLLGAAAWAVTPSALGPYPQSAALAAFLVGVACWAFVLRRTPVARVPQGLLIGALTALLAHPVMMGLLLALDSREHDRPLAELLRTWLGLTALSLLFVAWWTVPVGAVVGLATVGLARLRARLVS